MIVEVVVMNPCTSRRSIAARLHEFAPKYEVVRLTLAIAISFAMYCGLNSDVRRIVVQFGDIGARFVQPTMLNLPRSIARMELHGRGSLGGRRKLQRSKQQ